MKGRYSGTADHQDSKCECEQLENEEMIIESLLTVLWWL